MAAPTYAWQYVTNLYGLNPPTAITGKASASLETKVGTALILTSGQLDEATASVVLFAGFAAQATSAAASANDPIKYFPIRPGDVWKGTASADVSAAAGFSGKTYDFDTSGRLDQSDSSNGCLSVWYTENSGLTAYCVVNSAKMAMQ